MIRRRISNSSLSRDSKLCFFWMSWSRKSSGTIWRMTDAFWSSGIFVPPSWRNTQRSFSRFSSRDSKSSRLSAASGWVILVCTCNLFVTLLSICCWYNSRQLSKLSHLPRLWILAFVVHSVFHERNGHVVNHNTFQLDQLVLLLEGLFGRFGIILPCPDR